MKPPPSSIEQGYEPRDADVKWTVAGGLLLAGGIGLCLVVAAFVFPQDRVPRVSAHPEMGFQHGVVQRSAIDQDWEQQDALVREHLTAYGWVDRQRGIVRIPVRRAMDLMVAEAAKTPGGTQ